MLDVDFLLSDYGCAWGKGCKGIHGEPNHGCCAIGVNIGEEELEKVTHYVGLLSKGTWENYGQPWLTRWIGNWRDWFRAPQPNTTLRPDGEGCVFSNSADFSGGAGCAFHIAAMARGESYIGTKPYACWSIPLRLEFDNHTDMYWLRGVGEDDWGYGSNQWWCLDPASVDVEEIAWANHEPVYQRYDEVLAAMFDAEELAPIYVEQVKPMLDHLWKRVPKVTSGVIPVTIRDMSG